jgi:hypothetical protein
MNLAPLQAVLVAAGLWLALELVARLARKRSRR